MSDATVTSTIPSQCSVKNSGKICQRVASRFKLVGGVAVLVFVALTSGCGEFPTATHADSGSTKDTANIALTAPPTGANCPAVPATAASDAAVLDPKGLVKAAVVNANRARAENNPVLLLQSSLQYVRYDSSFIHPIGFTAENPPDLIEEAAKLAEKDIAKTNADENKGVPPVPANLKPDAVELELFTDLPKWAGKPSTVLPMDNLIRQLGSNANTEFKKAVADANFVIELVARHQMDRSSLIGQKTGPVLPAQPLPAAGNLGTLVLASISKEEHNTLLESLLTLASYRTFHVLTLLRAAHLHQMLTPKDGKLPSLDEVSTEVRLFNVARFLSTYFDAYFRGGQFIQFTADQQAISTTLATDLQSRMKTGLKTADVAKFIDDEFTKLCQGPNNASACSAQLGQTAFVTRAGLSVQFSGISFDVTTTKGLGLSHSYPQLSQFGPQLIRVLVEALFDANGLGPLGVPNSTACVEGLFPTKYCLQAGDKNAQQALGEIDLISTATESVTSMATGAAIRGLAVASLNNEAAAQSVETLIGVTARKIMERLLYRASLQTSCPIPLPQLQIQTADTTPSK